MTHQVYKKTQEQPKKRARYNQVNTGPNRKDRRAAKSIARLTYKAAKGAFGALVIIMILVSCSQPKPIAWYRGSLPAGEPVIGLWRDAAGEPYTMVCIQIGGNTFEALYETPISPIQPPEQWTQVPE